MVKLLATVCIYVGTYTHNMLITFSWKTKQDSSDTHCSIVRSLKAPLNIISVSSSSSPLCGMGKCVLTQTTNSTYRRAF